MGFTPLAGIPMGTRSGDIDPAIITFIADKEGVTADYVVQKILNKQSGVLGVSGLSNDFRDLELAAEEGNERASLALTIFANGLRKYIAAYAAVMNGVDAIIFTAGIGENSKEMRSRICEGLKFLGVAIDEEKNNCRSVERDISAPQSKVRVLIVPTNEELVIARDTREIAFS